MKSFSHYCDSYKIVDESVADNMPPPPLLYAPTSLVCAPTLSAAIPLPAPPQYLAQPLHTLPAPAPIIARLPISSRTTRRSFLLPLLLSYPYRSLYKSVLAIFRL